MSKQFGKSLPGQSPETCRTCLSKIVMAVMLIVGWYILTTTPMAFHLRVFLTVVNLLASFFAFTVIRLRGNFTP